MLLCIGEAMAETQASHRLDYPERWVSLNTAFGERLAGDAYNTALAVNAGHSNGAALLTSLGTDPMANVVLETCQQQSLLLITPQSRQGWTGCYVKQLNPHTGERQFLYHRLGSAASLLSPHHLSRVPWEKITGVFSTGVTMALSASCQQTVLQAFDYAHQKGLPIWFDLNIRPALWPTLAAADNAIKKLLPTVSYCLPSLEDLSLLANYPWEWPKDYTHLYDWITSWLSAFTGIMVITLGRHGAVYWPLGGTVDSYRHFACPVLKSAVVDTTGAGDQFNASLWKATQQGLCLDMAITKAVLEASQLVCGI
jgi:2-dehydro-3-deoxygluconokinase